MKILRKDCFWKSTLTFIIQTAKFNGHRRGKKENNGKKRRLVAQKHERGFPQQLKEGKNFVHLELMANTEKCI